MHGPPAPRPRSHRALTGTQVGEILAVLNSERFCDQAPAQIWATLLNEGSYLASVSTMYRILRPHHQVRERRRQARWPATIKPELVATGANQVWSWDIIIQPLSTDRVGCEGGRVHQKGLLGCVNVDVQRQHSPSIRRHFLCGSIAHYRPL
jgi:hypothetical protein